MLRWLAVCIVLACATFALVAVLVGPPGPVISKRFQPETPGTGTSEETVVQPAADREPPKEGPAPVADGPLPRPVEFPEANGGLGDLTKTVVIPGGTLQIVDQEEVPSPREGILVYIGRDLQPDDPELKPKEPPAKCLDVVFPFLAVQANPSEPGFTFANNSTLFRRWKEGDMPEPGKIVAARERKRVRKLQVGEWVERGERIALVNPAVAAGEISVQAAKLEASYQEKLAAGKAKDAAAALERSMRDANSRASGSVSQVEIVKAHLEYEKGFFEEKVKEAAIRSAQAELNKAAATLQQHEIRSSISGRVRQIYKNSEGDAVKANEAIVQIQNPNRLRVEGMLDVQVALRLKEGMEVIVEATRPEPPRAILRGHLHAVTCVAVSKGPKPLIVSGGEDHTLRGWDAATGQMRWLQPMGSAVAHAAACSPPSSSRNLLLVGDSTGIGRLFNLDDMKAEPVALGRRHEGAINCVAFSPDGSLCATGGDDLCLCLWKTDTGELLHRRTQAHRGPVTSVQFAGAGRVVTAGRDGTLAVWDFEEGKPLAPAMDPFPGRSGDVNQLGVSSDGRYVLFDQGRELKVLSLASKQMEGVLANPSSTMNFATMALFAPDGKSILTNAAAAGRLQLWRAPTPQARASELRQFIWDSAPATCAAFAPDGSFVVTGTQDHQVLVWDMPSEKEVETPPKAHLILVEKVLDTRSRQVRVWAELDKDNPGWLIPGGPATMVVPPQPAPLPKR